MYFLTVRGETRVPRLEFQFSAMRPSPHVGFSCAISRIKARRFFGSPGRPRFRDFHLQNVRNAVRCHLRNVSSLTMTRVSRQSKNLESRTMSAREAAVERRGLIFATVWCGCIPPLQAGPWGVCASRSRPFGSDIEFSTGTVPSCRAYTSIKLLGSFQRIPLPARAATPLSGVISNSPKSRT
jgi:hypothetical protein